MDWLAQGLETPTPGRTRVTFDAAHALLVANPAFTSSTTRPDLWEGLERYVARFLHLEREYADILGDLPLLHYLWLGGSFVSSKIDPQNIDMTVVVDGAARARLRGRPGAQWLVQAFARAKVLAEFGVSALELQYRVIPSVFRSNTLSEADQRYLRERGGWDDWWQRSRLPGSEDRSPSAESALAVRGYLEVTL